jgi:hypothetical protein
LESNWRWNNWEFGLWPTFHGLCGRIDASVNTDLVTQFLTPSTEWAYLENAAGTLPYTIVAVGGDPAHPSSFPYGFPVLPDH